jgi:hypothetical protein
MIGLGLAKKATRRHVSLLFENSCLEADTEKKKKGLEGRRI